MTVFCPPSMEGLNRPVVPFYRKRKVAGTVANLYLLQKPMRIVGELGSLIKIPIHFLEKRETVCHFFKLTLPVMVIG